MDQTNWFRAMASETVLYINGTQHFVNSSSPSDLSLNDFIREKCNLRGTKVMCREGGCGCCLVGVRKFDNDNLLAVNSCLIPVHACHGWKITTTEGIGSRMKGFNPVQARLAQYNGSQCGFCSPGMVMNMYCTVEGSKSISPSKAESIFDGNICRCTGYRAILDASKSFATPALDIEDLPLCKKTFDQLQASRRKVEPMRLTDGSTWHRPQSLPEILELLDQFKDKKIRLVVGNTATGVYKNDGPYDIYVDTSNITELYQVTDIAHGKFSLGSNVSLSSLIEVFTANEQQSGFGFCADISKHLGKVANVGVRNLGCWAGNLMTKFYHQEFPSDVFLLLSAVGAQLTIASKDGSTVVPVEALLGADMAGKMLVKMELQAKSSSTQLVSYKITPRTQNAHAYVNAALLLDYNAQTHVINSSRMYFGGLDGIKQAYIRAVKSEQFLAKKALNDPATVSGVLSTLQDELTACAEPKKQLCLSLLYKCILKLLGPSLPGRLQSGGETIQRPLMTSHIETNTNKGEWPLTQPMPRVTAQLQASGEAQYVIDVPTSPKTLYGAFVISEQGSATLAGLDASAALKVPGALRMLTAKDITGVNEIKPVVSVPTSMLEPVLCDGKIYYAGQPLAVVIGTSQQVANQAAKLVKVTYSDVTRPVTDIKEAVDKKMLFEKRHQQIAKGSSETAIKNSFKVVEGTALHTLKQSLL